MKIKLLSTLLILLGSAVGQMQPVALTEVAKDVWQGRNTTSKEILANVIRFENPHVTIYVHDYYLKPNGVMPNALELFPGVKSASTGTVLWVQYVDGTEWGDHNTGVSEVITVRAPLLQKMNDMVGAYSHGGNGELSAYIASHKDADPDFTHIRMLQQKAGTDGVLDQLKTRLSSAAKHDKMLGTK